MQTVKRLLWNCEPLLRVRNCYKPTGVIICTILLQFVWFSLPLLSYVAHTFFIVCAWSSYLALFFYWVFTWYQCDFHSGTDEFIPVPSYLLNPLRTPPPPPPGISLSTDVQFLQKIVERANENICRGTWLRTQWGGWVSERSLRSRTGKIRSSEKK